MNYMNRRVFGFTLTEVLIVVGIVAFLAVMILAYFRNQIFKARDAKRKADMHLIQEAVEEYEKDNDCYPDASLVICKPTGDGLRPYLAKIPCDPVSGDSYLYEPGGPTNCSKWYRMYAFLENQGVLVLGPEGVAYDYYVSSPNAPTPQPISTSAPTSSPAPSGPAGQYYACKSGVCVPISWNYITNQPECDPNWFLVPNCFGDCGTPSNPLRECVPQ